jgi:hypothetical protein
LKNKEKRLTVEEILKHPWVIKYSSTLRDLRETSPALTKFKFFSHSETHLQETSAQERQKYQQDPI